MTESRGVTPPLSLLVVNPMGGEGWGGVERWLVDLCRGLRERGHAVTMAGRPDSAWILRTAESGFDTITVPLRSDFHLGQARKLSQAIKERGIDVIATKLHRGIRASGFAAKFAGSPPVVAFMGLVEAKPGLRYRMTYDMFLDGVVTLTEDMRQKIVAAGALDADTVRAIPYGVIVDDYRVPDGTGAAVRDELGLPADAPVALAIGRLNEQKRYDLLLEAFCEVRKRLPKARLVIAGTGSLMQALVAKRDGLGLGGAADLIGFRRDVAQLLAAADTMVMSSDIEGLPMVILEAMASARPVVATTVGSIAEQVVPGETGELLPRRDVPALTDALTRMLSDRGRAAAMGQAARRRVEQIYPLDLCVRRTEAYLASLRRGS